MESPAPFKMKQSYSYDTVSEAINDLAKRGYTHDFNIHEEQHCLICNNTMTQLSPDEFEITEVYRFEGETDPADEMILYAIASSKHAIKGVLLNAYGIYADSTTSKIAEKLKKSVAPVQPIKRAEYLKEISREHHQGLLLCWKIKSGLSKKIPVERIKSYANWFYDAYLSIHFQIEEAYIFPILGMQHPLIIKAMEEHQALRNLFKEETELEKSLKQIMVDLDSHIRFEERVLFNQIQEVATAEQAEQMILHHNSKPFVENNKDLFWT